MSTILVPVDFSPVTPRVIDAAIDLARFTHSTIELIHVEPEPSLVRDTLPVVENAEQRRNSVKRTAERHLEALRQEYSVRSAGMRTEVFVGPAVEIILARAKSLDARYIVIGSHGHSALREAMLGSVAHEVVRGSKVPVMLVPAL